VLQEQAAQGVREKVRQLASSELASGGDAACAARAAFRYADEQSVRTLARAPGEPDCAPGCASCCHVHVEATTAEIAAAAAHLVATRSASELRALALRLALTAALPAEERWAARTPCALLAVDGTCSIYEVRPLRCRAFHSYSVEVCRDAYAGRTDAEPPRSPALERLYLAAEAGLEEALDGAGQATRVSTLEAGLHAALTRDESVG
jgi:Fe-S-cluster containining protein